jgi:Aspartyl protease
MSYSSDTENDAAIARALQEREDAVTRRASAPPIVQGRTVSSPHTGRYPRAAAAPIPPLNAFPPALRPHEQTNMCVVPCIIGNGVAVEMMVDTGAQSSVISTQLVRQLNLTSRLDQRYQGVAAGVGQARILGKLIDIGVELGHVEFLLDFIVLDAPDNLLLLGLDLMRRYKCIVDLERDVLIFGGKGGVEVNMLPAEEQHIRARSQLGCPMM